MNGLDIFSGILCAAAIVCAAHFPIGQRLVAVACSTALMAFWAIYTLTWSAALSPAIFLGVKAYDVWAFDDMLAGLLCLFVGRRYSNGFSLYGLVTSKPYWWGLALYGLFFYQAVWHWLRWQIGVAERDVYYAALDIGFYAQEAIFIAIGARGSVNRIANFAGRCRHLFPVRPALSAAKAVSRVRSR